MAKFRGDLLEVLGPDISNKILSYLDDPADVVRTGSLSRSWRQLVIESGLCKRLCLDRFPEVANVVRAIQVDNMINCSKLLEDSDKNHQLYAILAQGLSPKLRRDCISKAINASSTDNYPIEGIEFTLESKDRVDNRHSYWSSKGASHTEPERLTYRLISDFCFITEINVKPYQALFQYGFPVYSAKAVRFRMGHPKSLLILKHIDKIYSDDDIDWTYVSPEFPMTQESFLQKFKLPEPVLCVGGIVQVELLGRVQTQESDGLYYICVSHVQVVGRTLLPEFKAELMENPAKCMLSYCPVEKDCRSCAESKFNPGEY